jgi:hypothetical protein
MISAGFRISTADQCVFIKGKLIVSIYVDDVLSIGTLADVQAFRSAFKTRFRVSTEGGIASWYLGMEINQRPDSISLNQNLYIANKLEEFSPYLNEHEKRNTPLETNYQQLLETADHSEEEPGFPMRQIMGLLIHAAMGTRIDIVTATNVCCQFLDKPKKVHCDMVRRILYYLRAYPKKDLVYKTGGNSKLSAYVDASYGRDVDYHSRGGHAIMIGGCIVGWKSGKQTVVALASAESEYIQLTLAAKQILGMKRFLDDLGYQQGTVEVFEDNQACIALASNPQQHSKRTLHIQTKYHWVREQIKSGEFKLTYCPTRSMLADMFTKGLSGPLLQEFSAKLGLSRDLRQEEES